MINLYSLQILKDRVDKVRFEDYEMLKTAFLGLIPILQKLLPHPSISKLQVSAQPDQYNDKVTFINWELEERKNWRKTKSANSFVELNRLTSNYYKYSLTVPDLIISLYLSVFQSCSNDHHYSSFLLTIETSSKWTIKKLHTTGQRHLTIASPRDNQSIYT